MDGEVGGGWIEGPAEAQGADEAFRQSGMEGVGEDLEQRLELHHAGSRRQGDPIAVEEERQLGLKHQEVPQLPRHL